MKKIVLTNEQVLGIIKQYKSGSNLNETGEKFGISKPTVKKILIENGVAIKEPIRLTQEKIDKFLEKYKESGSVGVARTYTKIGNEIAIELAKEYDNANTKSCIYCGSIDIAIYKNGSKLPCCYNCKDRHFKEINEKRKETTLEKYGVENINQLESTIQKAKETNMEKYGTEHPLQNKEFYEEYKQRRVAEMGVDNNFKSEEFKERMKEYNQTNFGVDHVSQRDDVRKKISNSHLAISEEEKKKRSDKRKKTIINMYGKEYNSQIISVKLKKQQTFKERYGGTCSYNSPIIRNKIILNKRIKYWETFNILLSNKKIKPLFTKDFYITNVLEKFKYQCEKCNKIIETELITPMHIWCGCDKHRSQFEDQIINWLHSINITTKANAPFYYENTKNLEYEIDVYLPEYNIGIEFCGLYWHSNLFKDRNYHKDKYLYFKEKGIQLIQIFENEWIIKSDIIKSIISYKLKKLNSIYARNCKIKVVSTVDSEQFLSKNHIQGSIGGFVKIGLYYNGKLMSLMVLGEPRFSKDTSWEILRYATILNVSIVGGFQKLLKYFIDTYNPDTIVSFVDVRYFNGNSLVTSTFSCIKHTKPNYFYYKNSKPIETFASRIKYQKHKLIDLLDNYDDTKSEYENMLMNKYSRIFDAGNLKMLWKK